MRCLGTSRCLSGGSQGCVGIFLHTMMGTVGAERAHSPPARGTAPVPVVPHVEHSGCRQGYAWWHPTAWRTSNWARIFSVGEDNSMQWQRFFLFNQLTPVPLKNITVWKSYCFSFPCLLYAVNSVTSTLQTLLHPDEMNLYVHIWPWCRRTLSWGGSGWCYPFGWNSHV